MLVDDEYANGFLFFLFLSSFFEGGIMDLYVWIYICIHTPAVIDVSIKTSRGFEFSTARIIQCTGYWRKGGGLLD